MKSLQDQIQGAPKKFAGFDSDIDSDDLGNQLRKLIGLRYKSDTKDRRWLAAWTAFIVTGWLVMVMVILMNNDKTYCLSDTVLVTLLGTTTLNVLGVSYIVLRGHFYDANSSMK